MADPNPKKKSPRRFDLVDRGDKQPTPLGTLTFVGLRLLDLPLQHLLLSSGGTALGARLLARAGIGRALLAGPPVPPLLQTGLPFVDVLWHPTHLLLLLMAGGGAAKQIYWQTAVSPQSFPARAAAAVAAYNTVFNGANALLFLAWATTSLRSRPAVDVYVPYGVRGGTLPVPLSTAVGVLMYVVGLALETAAERQRQKFKDAPGNEGKVCKVGVWRWARHVNYLGYSLWRGGYTMVATGWVGGLLMAGWQMYDLGHRAAGVLDDYCSNRYKEQWAQFKREVPYKIIPGIY
ncbi:hypothetical protein F4819DRAFT_333611 [Hypoxylon fuscum]|nr:hypothetical protein F4819DRAFT_333611 [Hypoxylon fuscum]